MRAFVRSVPVILIDAARVEGASSFSILRRVLTPIGAPAIAAVLTGAIEE
jgi:ABC-type glycerol-3-phosphate transport system permease component